MDVQSKVKRIALMIWVSCIFTLASTATNAQYRWTFALPPSLDAGLMLGYSGGSRSGILTDTALGTNTTNSGSQDSSEIGLQLRLLFGSECDARPFVYLNGVRPIGTPVEISFGHALPLTPLLVPFPNSTKLTVATNWIGRLGLGISTPWLYDTFQLGMGAGAALMNQKLESFIGQETVTTFNKTQTSVCPSFMGNITWILCPTCIKGREALLTAQITGDYNSAITTTVPGDFGNLNVRVKPTWVARGDLIFSIKLL